MKKSLIALAALSAFATAAQAQSTVSVYGSIDAGYGSLKKDFTDTGTENVAANTALMKDSKNTGFNASQSPLTSSRFGVRGTEDLGGGLSASFNVETDLATQNGAMFAGDARTAIVGLSSKTMGTVQVGRQLTGIHGTIAGFNPLAGNNMVGDILYSAEMRMHNTTALGANGTAAIGGTNGALRVNNMLTYISPTFNGLVARVDYANDSRNADAAAADKEAQTKYQGLTLNYAQGPLSVSASTATAKSKAATAGAVEGICIKNDATIDGVGLASGDISLLTAAGETCATGSSQLRARSGAVTTANDDTKAQYDAISAQYKINPALALQASYAENKFTEEGALKNKSSAYRLGVTYEMNKWVFAGQYGAGEVESPTSTADRGTKADREAYQLAAIYNLSKRTNMYVAYGTQEQKITEGSAKVLSDKVKSTQYAVGVRHSF